MEKKQNIGVIVVVLLAIVAAMVMYQMVRTPQVEKNVDTTNEEIMGEGKQSMVPYQNQEFGISFEYPSGYYLKERNDVGALGVPQLSVLMVEDTQMHRDIIDGKVGATEGPTSIMVDAYQNPDQLSAVEWAKQDTNWKITSRELETLRVAGESAVSFTWDGLYQGKSIIVTKGTHAYVLSVTWNSPEDQILKDFDMVLRTVQI